MGDKQQALLDSLELELKIVSEADMNRAFGSRVRSCPS